MCFRHFGKVPEELNVILVQKGYVPFTNQVVCEEPIIACTYSKARHQYVAIFHLCKYEKEIFARIEEFYFDQRHKEWHIGCGIPIKGDYNLDQIPKDTVFYMTGKPSRTIASKEEILNLLLKR
jgi:hypothetical protein